MATYEVVASWLGSCRNGSLFAEWLYRVALFGSAIIRRDKASNWILELFGYQM